MSEPDLSRTEDGAVIYRRRGGKDVAGSSRWSRRRASSAAGLVPTLGPLLIGFALLLVLVMALGLMSVRRLKSVNSEIAALQDQYTARIKFLLQTEVAVTRLHDEARARMRTVDDQSPQIRPLFNIPLNSARDEVKALLPRVARLPTDTAS